MGGAQGFGSVRGPVLVNGCTDELELIVELHQRELAESRRVVVAQCLSITRRLQDRIGLDPNLPSHRPGQIAKVVVRASRKSRGRHGLRLRKEDKAVRGGLPA